MAKNHLIPMAMRKYNLLKAIPLSFFSKELYRDVAKNWVGVGFLYLFTILSIALLPVAIKVSDSIREVFEISKSGKHIIPENINNMINQVPSMYIDKGMLYTDAEQPYLITNPSTGKPIAIIDLDRTSVISAPMILTKNSVIITEGGYTQIWSWNEVLKVFMLSPSERHEINSDSTRELIERTIENSSKIPVAFYFIKLLSLFMFFALRIVLFTFLGTLICQFLTTAMPFTALMRLAAITSTPIIMFESLSLYIGQDIFGYRELVYFIMHGGYLYFAIDANKKVTPDDL